MVHPPRPGGCTSWEHRQSVSSSRGHQGGRSGVEDEELSREDAGVDRLPAVRPDSSAEWLR